MGRKPRPQIADGIYHVTTRGNGGASIFTDDFDRTAFLARLGHAVGRSQWDLFAYCLMGNHFHLMIRTPEPNIALGMHTLNQWYAQRFNWRHDRTGHVFEGPYGAELIENEGHLLEVTRYVVCNPVRAGLCGRPEQWPWSSYRAAIGVTPRFPWLAIGELLLLFADSSTTARERYRSFVEEGADRIREDMARDQVRGLVPFGPGLGPGPGTGPI
jgi:putative transposase